MQRMETTTGPIAEGRTDPGSVGRDHLLLVLKAVINDTCVSALVDSGATRSFVSEQLHTRPPMEFIGAYSSLELANGQTIVATRIAPNVLVSIGDDGQSGIFDRGANDGRHLGHPRLGLVGYRESTGRLEDKFLGTS